MTDDMTGFTSIDGPYAWRFELARAILPDGATYHNWSVPQVSETKPCVPEGSIRNLTPLYAIKTNPEIDLDNLPQDVDGNDPIENLVSDATVVEGAAAQVHEGSSYFAERVIRRALKQGNLRLDGDALKAARGDE
jgi:hypothetical protein